MPRAKLTFRRRAGRSLTQEIEDRLARSVQENLGKGEAELRLENLTPRQIVDVVRNYLEDPPKPEGLA
jgi:hypothetical protein